VRLAGAQEDEVGRRAQRNRQAGALASLEVRSALDRLAVLSEPDVVGADAVARNGERCRHRLRGATLAGHLVGVLDPRRADHRERTDRDATRLAAATELVQVADLADDLGVVRQRDRAVARLARSQVEHHDVLATRVHEDTHRRRAGLVGLGHRDRRLAVAVLGAVLAELGPRRDRLVRDGDRLLLRTARVDGGLLVPPGGLVDQDRTGRRRDQGCGDLVAAGAVDLAAEADGALAVRGRALGGGRDAGTGERHLLARGGLAACVLEGERRLDRLAVETLADRTADLVRAVVLGFTSNVIHGLHGRLELAVLQQAVEFAPEAGLVLHLPDVQVQPRGDGVALGVAVLLDGVLDVSRLGLGHARDRAVQGAGAVAVRVTLPRLEADARLGAVRGVDVPGADPLGADLDALPVGRRLGAGRAGCGCSQLGRHAGRAGWCDQTCGSEH